MEKAIPALQQLYNDGIAARQQLEALKNMLTPEQQEAIAAGSAQIEQQANAQLATINESIAAWGQQLESLGIKVQTLDDLPYAIADMTQKLAEINTGIATMQEAQKQVDAGKIALDEASAQLTKNQIEGILQLSLPMQRISWRRDRASWMRQRIAQRNLRIWIRFSRSTCSVTCSRHRIFPCRQAMSGKARTATWCVWAISWIPWTN